MLVVQSLISFGIHRRVTVPAERFQRFSDKLFGLSFIQTTLLIVDIKQSPAARREDVALRQNSGRLFT
ncbi:hypothetical protein D3C79_1105960 [compost metagenome]